MMNADAEHCANALAMRNIRGVMNDPYINDATYMSKRTRTGIGIYLLVVNLALFILLVAIWPGIEKVFPKIMQLPDEIRYILIAAVGGAFGMMAVLIASFTAFVGNRALVSSWAWWYIAHPFIGMTLGVMVYFAIRGGVLKTGSDPTNLNPYTVAALCGLAGMFSTQILAKLRDVANKQFRIEAAPQKQQLAEGENAKKTK
jgi:hypothetical protein